MITPLDLVQNLLTDMRITVEFAGNNDLPPLEAIELILLEQQMMCDLKAELSAQATAALPVEKTLQTIDFGFQRIVSREQMLRLSDIT